MSYLMSIDLGTSSVKTMIISENGEVLAIQGAGYDINIPEVGFAEQDPNMWYEKTVETIQQALVKANLFGCDIKAVSFSGQMHGLVCVDTKGKVLCPAIIWPDQRSQKSISHIYEQLGKELVALQTQNTITTGFLLASLYWIYEKNRPLYEKIDKVMLPKDYIKFRLTGRIITDYSDAAGSLAFDNINLCWAKELIEKLGLHIDIFPECRESSYIIGTICSSAAGLTGLSEKVKVVNGGSDQCMQGIGNGIIIDGVFASNIGTGGQISTSTSKPMFDEKMRTNTFAHAVENRWNVMGACLSSGASLKWLTNDIIGITNYNVINEEAEKLPIGSEGLLFLPYLAGERTPHQDSNAKGVFCGMTLKHNRYHMARAVMEGVTFSLKDCMEVVTGIGISCNKVIASGGGSNSKLWLQMQADIFEQDIYRSITTEQACLGAAITAGVGVGIYSGYEQACENLVELDNTIYHPIEKNVSIYNEYYLIFKELYKANKGIFEALNKVNK